MVLEINVASICASVPIFWPVLRPYLGAIFVTREFSVTTERREASVSSHQRLGSEADLNAHYKDDYIMDLVGPFNSKDGQSRVKIENGGKKTKKERGRPRV